MKRTIAYYRSSSTLQKNSIGMQQSKARQYARVYGMVIEEEYEDEFVSARKNEIAQRPEMYRLIQDIRAGSVGTVLVYKRDRLARRASDYIEFYRMCKSNGVKILFTADSEIPVTYTSVGEFIELILAGVVEHEGNQIVERLRETQIANFLAKKKAGNLPYGLRDVPDGGGKVKLEYLDQDMKTQIESIFSSFLSWNGKQFADFVEIVNNNYPRKRAQNGRESKKSDDLKENIEENDESTEWTEPSLKALLANALYRGVHRKGWERVVHEVDRPECRLEIDFDMVDEKLAPFLSGRSFAPEDVAYVLNGIAVCGACNKPLVGGARWNKRSGYSYFYACRTKQCRTRIDKESVEKAVTRALTEFLRHMLSSQGNEIYSRSLRTERKRIAGEMEKVDEQLSDLRASLVEEVSRYLEMGNVTKEMSDLKKRIDEEERKHSQLEGELQRLNELPRAWVHFHRNILVIEQSLASGSAERLRDLLLDVTREVRIRDRDIERIQFRHPFQEAQEHVCS